MTAHTPDDVRLMAAVLEEEKALPHRCVTGYGYQTIQDMLRAYADTLPQPTTEKRPLLQLVRADTTETEQK